MLAGGSLNSYLSLVVDVDVDVFLRQEEPNLPNLIFFNKFI